MLCYTISRQEGTKNLNNQRGNFLMQALLAVGLIFVLVPFLAQRLADKTTDSKMFTATQQIETAQTAARIFIRENAKNINYNTTIVSGNDFSDLLEPYGLPLGFVPRTPMGQDIALVIQKTPYQIIAYLELSGGNLSALERAELSRRIGYYASTAGDVINVGIELGDVYSDVVRRNEPNIDNSGFLTDLDMGGFKLDNVGNIFSISGHFDSAEFTTLSITGTESSRKIRNKIGSINTNKSVFQSANGESALSINRGTLLANSLYTKTISMFGDTGNIVAEDVSIYDFSMTAGHTNFSGPSDWLVHGNVKTTNINISTERLDISSYLNATRGQEVYVDGDSLTYNSKSGIETNVIYTSNITVRDQTSNALSDGETGAVILDIRPGGTTMLPDAYVSDVNNDGFKILERPLDNTTTFVDCKDIIDKYEGVYNKQSLSQYLICQYVYWQRLEKRINAIQCLKSGQNGCI